MAHSRHRTIKRAKKKFKRLAAAVAGAAILSGAMLPGIPAATVHAAASPNPVNPPVAATQQIADQHQSQSQPVLHSHSNVAGAAQTGEKGQVAKAPTDYKQVLDIRATAYAPGPHDNDQWGSKTFIGTQVRPGIIAVDPSVIPLHSRVFIQYPDGHGEYAVAEDTGGAIKGNRIDVAKATVEKAQDFGLQQVKVYVLK